MFVCYDRYWNLCGGTHTDSAVRGTRRIRVCLLWVETPMLQTQTERRVTDLQTHDTLDT
jgi:hypothetical protein